MYPPRRVRAWAALLILAILGTVFVVVPRTARADAGAPRWTAGDYWLYVNAGNPSHTLRVEVVARENTRTLRGNVYETWHVRETDTNGSFGFTTDLWMTDTDLGKVNSSATFPIIGLTITTYEPAQAQAQFPLRAQASWNIPLNVSVKVGNGGVTTAASRVQAQVDGEVDVTVPAGTFHSFVIRGLGGGNYMKLYYSEQAGYWSKQENYNAQDQKTREMTLTSYKYQWSTTFLLIIVGVVVLAGMAVAGFIVLRRRRRGAPGVPPPSPPPTQ